jgi:hypothetical protein
MNLARIVFRHCVYEFLWAERISRHFVFAKLSFWSTVGTGMLAKRRLAYFWAYVLRWHGYVGKLSGDGVCFSSHCRCGGAARSKDSLWTKHVAPFV